MRRTNDRQSNLAIKICARDFNERPIKQRCGQRGTVTNWLRSGRGRMVVVWPLGTSTALNEPNPSTNMTCYMKIVETGGGGEG